MGPHLSSPKLGCDPRNTWEFWLPLLGSQLGGCQEGALHHLAVQPWAPGPISLGWFPHLLNGQWLSPLRPKLPTPARLPWEQTAFQQALAVPSIALGTGYVLLNPHNNP